jgi:hypothetical protein
MTYIADTEAPNNPDVSTLTAKNQLNGQTTLTSDHWYNYPNPSFSFLKPSDPVTKEYELSSGIAGYLTYFGTDNTVNIALSNGLVSVGQNNSAFTWQSTVGSTETYTSNITLISGNTYYLKVIAVDNAGNVHRLDDSSSYNLFTYKYDTDLPAQVDYINASPVGCSTASTFTFTWPASSDANSGIGGYEYKSGINGDIRFTTDTTISIPPYRDDENVLYVRRSLWP